MPNGSGLSSPFLLRALNHTRERVQGPGGDWEGQSLNKIILNDRLYITKWHSTQPSRFNKTSLPAPQLLPREATHPSMAGRGSRGRREWYVGWIA